MVVSRRGCGRRFWYFGDGWSVGLRRRRRRVLGGAEAVSKTRAGWCWGWLMRTGIFLLPTVFEAEAVSIHLENVDMMGQPIQ